MPAKKKTTYPTEPRSFSVEDTFVWNSPDAEVGQVIIPLRFPAGVIRAAKDLDEIDFIFSVLDGIKVPPATTDAMDMAELKAMFRDWQLAWEKRQEAAFPEA